MEANAATGGGVEVRTVVRDVVAEVAPEELPILAGLAGFDDDTVVARFGRRARDEPLGFGLDELAVLVTPTVWLAVDQAARRFGTAAADGAAGGLKAAVRRIARRKKAPVVVPALTPEQLAGVRRQVVESAVRLGFKEQRAMVIADSVVARLALAATSEPDRESAHDDDSDDPVDPDHGDAPSPA